MKNKLKVQDILISVSQINEEDFISLTDMARYKKDVKTGLTIQNWLRNQKTIEFLTLWEKINNPNFKNTTHFILKNRAGSKNFSLSAKDWIEKTGAIGIISRAGRYGGTYAHKDIVSEFDKWLKLTPKAQPNGLYIIKVGEFCKIGITQNINARIKTIETYNPLNCELLFYEKIENSRGIEHFLHQKLKNKNIKNEWFKLSKKDINSVIQNIVELTKIEYLTDRQKEIIDLANIEISTTELHSKIRFSKTTILKELKYLIKIGKIKKIRKGRKITYKNNHLERSKS